MPPKVPPKKTLEEQAFEAEIERSDLETSLLSPKGIQVPLNMISVSCSSYSTIRYEARLRFSDKQPKSPEPEAKSDYVDIYFNGKLIAEGEPRLIVSEDEYELHTSDGYKKFVSISNRYIFEVKPERLFVTIHGKESKKIFKRTVEIDLKRVNSENSCEVIFYYQGNEVFRTHPRIEGNTEAVRIIDYQSFDEKAMLRHYKKYGK